MSTLLPQSPPPKKVALLTCSLMYQSIQSITTRGDPEAFAWGAGHLTKISTTVFPRFSAAPIRLQILISAPVRVSARPSNKHPLQISLDFDQISPPLGWRARTILKSTNK